MVESRSIQTPMGPGMLINADVYLAKKMSTSPFLSQTFGMTTAPVLCIYHLFLLYPTVDLAASGFTLDVDEILIGGGDGEECFVGEHSSPIPLPQSISTAI